MTAREYATVALFILSIILIVSAVYVASDKETIVKLCNQHYYYEMAKCNCFGLTNYSLNIEYNYSLK